MKKTAIRFVANAFAHCFGGVSLNDCIWVVEKARDYNKSHILFTYDACAQFAVEDWFDFYSYPYNKREFIFLYNTAYNALKNK